MPPSVWDMKRYRIAGLLVDMDPIGRTAQRAAAYEVPAQGPADVQVLCSAEEIMELNPHLQNADNALYLGTGAIFSRELLAYDGTYLHASAVELDGKAYLFSADSGVGKSTHTEKWCRLFGAVYLNDDKPALRRVDGVWMAYGTPWSGKYDLSTPKGAPLGGIAFMKRGEENAIRPLPAKEAVPLLMHQSLWRLELDQMEKQLALLDDLIRRVPIWELTCRNEDAAAILSRDAMTGNGQKQEAERERI